MNENNPVKSLYTTPFLLSANAPKQKTFAMDSSSLAMTCGVLGIWIGWAGWMTFCWAPRLASWITLGIIGTGVICGDTGVVGIFVVLQMLCLGLFTWPLVVAGLGLRYLRIIFSDMLGQQWTNPWCVAFRSLDILGLHNDWCANMMELAWVLMKCVKVARSMRLEWSTALGF